MTSKERMLIAMTGGQADRVPVAPDMSNMIPCKLTGKPFWDIYLYQDPPLWKAYIDAVKHFGFDGWMPDVPNYLVISDPAAPPSTTMIVHRSEEQIITRQYTDGAHGKRNWSPFVMVYYRDNPPSWVRAEKLNLDLNGKYTEPITGVKPVASDGAILREAKAYMGERGVLGVSTWLPALGNPETSQWSIYDYYDRYAELKAAMEQESQAIIRRVEKILAQPEKPDFIFIGVSGLLIFNTPDILRDLSLETLKIVTCLARQAGLPSQVHCCGPEKELVKMCAEETDLTSINPLEIPPMGDCRLKEIKARFGKQLSLMGNIHTTDIMLRGSVRDVEAACKQAIDDAGAGGGYILSTGDQCGRDTPPENISKMIEVAENYGKY